MIDRGRASWSASPVGFLVVEDEDAQARTIARAIQCYGTPRRTATAAAARQMLGVSSRWAGLIVDVGLPDECGLDLLEAEPVRAGAPPVLVLTGSSDRENINRAFRLGAEYLCKPAEPADLGRFARRALVQWWTDNRRVACLVDELAERAGLRPAECEIVAMCAGGVARHDLARALRVTSDTLKSRVRRLLRKCEQPSIDELVRDLLKDATAGSELARVE